MADLPTTQELFRIARDEVLLRNSNLSREIVERPGTDANALTSAGVGVGDAVVGQLAKAVADFYLRTAKGSSLDRWVADRYRMTRKAAAPALGAVQFTSTGTPLVSFTIPAGTSLSTEDGVSFTTDADLAWAAGTTGPYAVAVTSTDAGLSQQATAGTITTIDSPIASAPEGIAVTNLTATAGADDEETDAELQVRASLAYATQYRGVLKAIVRGALAVPGVNTATAFEYVDTDGSAARVVEVVIADKFTEQLINAATSPPSYQAQATALASTVAASLDDYRAAGIQVHATIANVAVETVSLRLAYLTGFDTEVVRAKAIANAIAFVNSLSPGASLIVADLKAAVRATAGVATADVALPAGDVIPTATVVIRTSSSYVTA
jgi:hypothetical protein